MRAESHPPLVERVLLAVAEQWPALVAGGWVDVGGSWTRTAGDWTEARVESALDWLARAERPPTAGQLLAATRPARGPAASGESDHPAMRAQRQADARR